ncbi:MAG: xanthine dehydrogenase family protein, partial [Acidobacteria bacterium]|nr:xanthine dehydrogenase family protein [Acidobacteriota bacterium]
MASILGTRVQRVEDPRFLTVGGTYSDDLRDPRLAGALHVTFVRSTMAHARLSSVDVSAARSAPGVVAVLTAADLGLEPKLSMRMFNKAMTRSPLADGVVRFVGELIAAILTEERYQGADAAELVEIDYDPLPVVVDPLEAAEDRVLLFPEAGTNVSNAIPAELDDHLFDGCEVTVTQTILNRRLAIAPLEPRACAAVPGDDGRLLAWLSSQGAQGSRDAILTALGLEAGQLHVLTPDVGGGFGGKSSAVAAAEDIVVCRAARVLGRPVRWVESRTDNVSTMHGRGQVQTVTMGGTRDGRIEAYRLSVLGEAGAYPTIGALLPMMTRMMAPGVYDIAKVEVETKSVVTNTAPTVAYRGAGRPEACAAIERAVDLFAAEIGMDPVEVRRRNMVAAFAEPHTTPMGTTYDVGDYPGSLALVLEAADYDELRAEQARRRAAGDRRQLGIGLAAYVEVTGFGGSEVAKIEVKPDGGAVVYTGTSPHGQGHHTSWAMIASDRLGIPIDKIEFVYGDTDLVPVGGGTGGSRSLQLGGSAVHETAGLVIEEAKQRAAKQLEANPDDIILDVESGRFHVAGSPTAARSWSEVAGD